MKRLIISIFALWTLASTAFADLVGLYSFDGSNPLEAVIGSPAKEGVSSGNNQAATLTDTMSTLSLVLDSAVLGDRTGVIAVPSRSTLAIPNPGLQKNWTIAFSFYVPENAPWRCFFQFGSSGNSSDGSLFIRSNTDIGASGSYTTGISGIVGAWHQLVVSSANNTQTIWLDQQKLDQTRAWDIAGMSLLQFSLDNDGEDATMYFDEIRLYDETAPVEVFPDGVLEGPALLARWTESSYTDTWGSFSRAPDRIIEDLPSRTYVFSRHGSFTFAPNKASAGAEILVVGGGGAGGLVRGGGGGGGAVVHVQHVNLAAQTYTATVGAGGIPDIFTYWYYGSDDTGKLHPGPSTAATCGGASSVSTAGGTIVTAPGGGGGGNFNYANGNIPAESYGLDGASGGGASGKSTTPGLGTNGLGHDGGEASTDGDNSGGGGGGAGASGTNGSNSAAGAGGAGIVCSITGEDIVYGGGGGASSYNLDGGLPGEGGGGTGVSSKAHQSRSTDCNGVDGLGGGGGGGSGFGNRPSNFTGGRGGDGTVILRVFALDDSDPSPILALTADPVSYTNATLSARLIAFGPNASSATVSLVVSASQDLSDPIFSGVLAADTSTLGSFEHVFFGLVTNKTYYAQATAVNDKNETGVSALVTFTTLKPLPAAGTATFAWRGSKSMGATANLSDYGAGSSSAVLRLEASADGFETVVASAETAATTGSPAEMAVSGLVPETSYALRFRFVNEWGVISYAPVSGTFSTRATPLASTGIGYRFSADETIVDFSFGVTAVYDGATLSATLSYDGTEIGTQNFSSAGTLSWPGIPSAGKVATATVTVVSELDGNTCTDVWELTVTPGASARAVANLSELRSTSVRKGDTIVLPELFRVGEHYLPLDMRSFKLAADGVTLVALEPGFSAIVAYRYNEISGVIERDATIGLAICAPKPEGAGRVFLAKPQPGKWNWASASNWENLTDNEADYPHLVDDVAIAPMPKNQLVVDADVTVAALYIGQDTSSLNSGDIRFTGKNSSTITFSRSSGEPGLLRITGLARYDEFSGFFRFRIGGGDGNATSGLGIEMPGGLDVDCGDWPDLADTATRAKSGRVRPYMGESLRYWNIPAGKTLRFFNVYCYTKLEGDDQGGNANFSWGNNAQVTGEGTWLYDGASSTYIDDPFYRFEGTVVVRNKQKFDSGFSMGSRGGSFWMVNWTRNTQFATNATLLVEGDATYNNGIAHGSSFGVLSSGNSHGYGSWGAAENVFPAKKWILNGGVARISGMANTSWGTPPIAVPNGAETLVVSNGFFSIQMFNSQGSDRPTNVLHFAALEHAGDGVVHVRTDRLWNSHNKSLNRDFVVLEGFAGQAIGGTGVATYSITDSDAANILDANAPIVPWIVGSVNGWQNLYFPGAASDGVLVLGGHPVATVLAEAADPTANIRVSNTSIALAENLTVNSLVLQNNTSKEMRLGEDRTLTLTSGGLILGDSNRARIGTEAGLADESNGTLYFPRKAYVYSPRQSASDPNEIWSAMVSPNGAAFSFPGDLRIGGDQTGIDGRISVNGTRLQLGSSSNGCEIDVPVHLYGANSKIVVNKAGSFCGQELWFWDHGTPGSMFVPAAGTTEAVAKCYVDGVALQRGTWGSSQSAAEHIDDNHFSGTGMIEVLADEMSGPDIANPVLVTLDDTSATFSFDLWPGFGADSVEVYALVTAAGGGDVLTNLIYSSEAPADGHFEGTLYGLEPETAYTARLLAVNQSGGDSFATECPDAVAFTTLAAELTPLVQLGEPSAVGPGEVTLPWMLARAGSGRTAVSVRLYWAESAAALDDLSNCQFVEAPAADRVPGNHATELARLRPGCAYFALLVAENDGETDNVATSGPVAFSTASENCLGVRSLGIGSCVRTPDQFTAVVSAPEGEPAFPNVYMVWGTRYGGEAVSNWDGSMRVGAMDTSASFLTATVSAANLGDAVYVRFVGMTDSGKSAWSPSYYLPDIPAVAEVLPKVGSGSIAPGANDVLLSAYVFNVGSLSQDGLVGVSLEYALTPDAFLDGSLAKVWRIPFANDVPAGAVAPVRIGNLRAGRRYYARFVGVNDHDQSGAGDIFTFDTLAGGVCSVGASDWGLRQLRLYDGNGNAADLDNLVWNEGNAAVVEGVVMAYRYAQTPWTSEKTGASYTWANQIGFFYKGWIFLERGITYTIGSSIDDSCIVKIGGLEVLRQVSWDKRRTFANFTPDETCWYEFEVRLGNGSGGAGAGEDNYTFGLGWNTTGTETVSASTMQPFLDPGDGSFLRPFADRAMTVISAEHVSGGVSATVKFSAGLPTGTLRAFWGATDCVTNQAAWANSSGDLATVDGTETEATIMIPVADLAATPCLRIALMSANGAELWTTLLLLDDSQPTIGDVSMMTDGDRMTVSGSVLSLGSGNGYTLRLHWGYAEDFSDAQSTNIAVAAAGAFAATVPVVPGTNGWWYLVTTTVDGGYDATLPATFVTKAGSVLANVAAVSSVSHHDITAAGTLDVLGAGETTVSLWYGEDDNPSNFVQIAAMPVTEAGAIVFNTTITGAPRTVFFQLRSENVAPGGTTWSSASDVFSGTTTDAATYTWKIEKTEGYWDDPDNWTVSGVTDPNDTLGYPNNAKAKVRFVADTTAEIAVTNEFVFADMSLKYANLAVTFVGTDATTCKLTGDVTGVANDQNDGTVVSGTRVVLSGVTLYDSSGAFNWATKASADCTLRLENGSALSMDGYMHVFGTNTWVEVASGSSVVWRRRNTDGAGFDMCNYGGGLVVDNATFDTSWLTPQRHVGSVGESQRILVSGMAARLGVGYSYRTYNNDQDKMLNNVDFVFSIPLWGWRNPGAAPVYADYERGTDDKKMFAYRSPVGEGKTVFSIDRRSPLLWSGRARTVQLLEWKAGIDTANVEFNESAGVTMYYTYGWPSVRKEPESVGEIPTGVAADIAGIGATIIRLR